MIQCGATNLTSVPREIPMDASSVYLDGNKLGLLPAETFLGRSKVTELFLNSSLVTGLSNGTFLGCVVLVELDLSNNLLDSLQPGHLTGLQALQVLHLHHNRLQWLHRDTFLGLSHLRSVSLHNNQLVRLDISLGSGALKVLTLHDNNWSCRDKSDCAWVNSLSQSLDGLNLTQLTCLSPHSTQVSLLSFLSSCTNLDVLPVSSQTSSSSSSLMVLSVLLIAMVLVTAILTAMVVMKHLMVVRGHGVVTYIHYSSQDQEMVVASVGKEVGKVVKSICYHHKDLSTKVSVGQAISTAVESSSALVITASPAYTQSAITMAELHIIAGCVQRQSATFPVIVMVRGLEIEQVDMAQSVF